MSKFAILISLAVFVGSSNCFCIPPWSGGTINVCKQLDKFDCIGAASENNCKSLDGGPFVSGFTTGNYQCTIYSSENCSGTAVTVDKSGWSHFPIVPKSFKCPCQ